MDQKVKAVIDIWENPGVIRAFHGDMRRQLKCDWPALAEALEELAESKTNLQD